MKLIKKLLATIVITGIAVTVAGEIADDFLDMDYNAIGAMIVGTGFIVFFICMYEFKVVKEIKELFSKLMMKLKGYIDDSDYADLYHIAEEEYDRGEMDKGLWSQALVKAKGDEKLRKVEYIKLRVKQLKKTNR